MPFVLPDDLQAFLVRSLGSREVSQSAFDDARAQLAALPVYTPRAAPTTPAAGV